jgi:phenylpropionate dioxygenase-like ring-hydroxylating dioxygenase large terminal subunit
LFLDGLADKLDDYPFGAFTDFIEFTGVFEANWKVAVDAFQEAYHLGFMHKNTIGPQFAAGANPAGRMISAEFFGEHHSGSIWGNPDFEPRPIEATAFAFASLIAGKQASAEEKDLLPPTINPSRDPEWVVEMNVFFPNNQLFVSRQGFLHHSFWPLSHDRTRWYCRLYYRPLSTARQKFAQQFQASLSRDTFLEDATTIGNIGRALKSGILKEFRFQDGEAFPRHLMQAVGDRVDRWRAGPAFGKHCA